ncbi:MAG: thymidylate kinase [Oscillospiraceae bacterium]
MHGKLIVIEGLDGSGKATQTKLLLEALKKERGNVDTVSFPDYDSDSSALVRMYLGGQFGEHPNDVNSYAASVFYAVDRYASFKVKWEKAYESGVIFVADRYTTSNALYQMAKLEKSQWDGYMDWLFDFEYGKLGIPRPDLVIFLSMSPFTSERLMNNRYGGDDSKKDIHEKYIDYQKKSREAALYCAKCNGWKTIECDADGTLRSAQDIAVDVRKAALEEL